MKTKCIQDHVSERLAPEEDFRHLDEGDIYKTHLNVDYLKFDGRCSGGRLNTGAEEPGAAAAADDKVNNKNIDASSSSSKTQGPKSRSSNQRIDLSLSNLAGNPDAKIYQPVDPKNVPFPHLGKGYVETAVQKAQREELSNMMLFAIRTAEFCLHCLDDSPWPFTVAELRFNYLLHLEDRLNWRWTKLPSEGGKSSYKKLWPKMHSVAEARKLVADFVEEKNVGADADLLAHHLADATPEMLLGATATANAKSFDMAVLRGAFTGDAQTVPRGVQAAPGAGNPLEVYLRHSWALEKFKIRWTRAVDSEVGFWHGRLSMDPDVNNRRDSRMRLRQWLVGFFWRPVGSLTACTEGGTHHGCCSVNWSLTFGFVHRRKRTTTLVTGGFLPSRPHLYCRYAAQRQSASIPTYPYLPPRGPAVHSP